MYDKAVNRKSNVHFHPRQTIDFISNNMAHATLTEDVKRRIVKQYLDVSKLASSDECIVCMHLFALLKHSSGLALFLALYL